MTNTISNDMKKLKVVLKEAFNMGIITETPFRMFKIKSEETERETLSSQEVTLINDSFCMDDYSPKEIVKDWLLFMVYTGLAYSDLQKLSSNDIVTTMNSSKVISIKRQKTKQAATIPLFIHAERIIEKYKSFPEIVVSGKLLPNRSNQYINRTLKEIMKDFKINKLITCHCARHTHACIAKDLGVPIESISKTLGHSKISMTQHYTKISTNRIQLDYMPMGDFLNKSEIKSKIS
jgi:site-specific recombinase XerD